MSSLNGIPFLLYCTLKWILIGIWMNEFKMYKCIRIGNEIWIQFISRIMLVLITFGSSLDDIRIFLGSILSENDMEYIRIYSLMMFALHLILLPYYIIIGTIILTFRNNYNNNIYPESKRMFSIIWIACILVWSIETAFGIYTYIQCIPNISVKYQHGIYKWSLDKEWVANEANIIIKIGERIPIVISLYIIIILGIIGYKYKLCSPFIIVLICTLGQGLTPALSDVVFYFTSNFWEFVFFVAMYITDVCLYKPAKRSHKPLSTTPANDTNEIETTQV